MQSIILFFGENTYLINQKASLWEQEFIKKHGDLNLIKLEGKRLTAREIYEQANQTPFLSDKKLLIVRGFLENKSEIQKEFLEYIERIADFTVVLFVETKMPDKRLSLYKYITKNCRTEEFTNLEGNILYDWIIREVQKRDSQIGFSEAKYLTEIAGLSMQSLSNEIEKLSLNRLHKAIRREDIDTLTVPKLSYNVFKLTDAVAAKNAKLALKILEELKQFNEEMPMLFHMIVRQFRILIQIRDCLDKGLGQADIKRSVPEHPFVIMNGMKQAANFQLKDLKEIYTALLDIEKAFKGGRIRVSVNDQTEFELALQKLVVTHC
ncbi:DNA polymerase III subunit delta [Candidatus Peregrinibacteria bacterium]|jgi:DNA polymerase III subunit delta|nr:DNA polymerase III subunit delta [Candidatus Peregrinibacteria bacterium]